MKLIYLLEKVTTFVGAFVGASIALANPVLNNIGSGNVSVHQSPSTTVINQSSPKAILNWKSFNINRNQATHFQQPAGGVTLNRIDPTQGVSQIYGRLSSTGQIILINPAGIYFGPSAYVNVGGLIATTANIKDDDFLRGNYKFSKPSTYSGAIVNEGKIIARENGLVALVAPSVINNGLIKANLGKVVIGSGETFTMNFSGDNLINFSIDTATSKRAIDKNGNRLGDGVRNTGSIIADGGKVIISAKAARGVLDHVINLGGNVQARSVAQVNGEIILSGDSNGIVRVAGNINASGKAINQKGGKVIVTGQQILIDTGSKIDVSGDRSGGNITIGGGYQGKSPLPHAEAVVMMPGSQLIADAITSGNGGEIVLWSDNVTKVYGKISARGGLLSGDGGLIETSSKNYLEVGNILVDASAPNGKLGTWLLDPRNIDITASTNSGTSTSGGNPNTYTAIADNAQISAATINANLATASVIITTGSTGTQDGDINVNAPLTWSSTNSLTLIANRNINVNAGINWSSTGSLTLTANQDINVNAPISWSSTGSATLSAVHNINVNSSITNTTSSAANLYLIANSAGNYSLGSGQGIVTIQSPGLLNLTGTANVYFNPTTYSAPLPANYSNPAGTFKAFKYINSPSDLQFVSNTNSIWTSNFALSKNIDASSLVGFVPIGTGSSYSGFFDGLNHEISNLTINTSNVAGLFGTLSAGGISNLGLTNLSVTSSNIWVGGLVGLITGTGSFVTNSYAIGTVTPTVSGGGAGGLVGGLEGINSFISNSYSGGSVGGLGIANVGGLVGHIVVSGGAFVTTSYSTSNVSTAGNGGGLVGFQGVGAVISNSYASGNVTGNTIGGLVGGSLNGTIINSYALGNVTGISGVAGGLVGACVPCNISTSYATGAVSAPATVGGVIGNRSGGAISNTYWDTQTSGRANSVGAGSVAGMTGLTTTQFKTLVSFAGFTITSTISTTTTKPTGTWFIFAGQTRPILLTEWSNSIANAHQLQLAGSTLGASYTLTKDISLVSGMTNAAEIWGTNSVSGAGFVPIGNSSQRYSGTFEGASHTIDGLYIKPTVVASYLGLFGATQGTIQNLTLTNINIPTVSGSFNIAGIAGVNFGTISNVNVSGSINAGAASTDVAGIAGINAGTITNAVNTANILSGTGSIGGVAGYNNGTITNSSNAGSITINGSTGGNGGLAGWNDVGGFISNSYNSGSLSVSNNQKWIGGLVGINNATIQNSYNSGSITAGTNNLDVGGLVGLVSSTGNISNSYSTGNVSVGATSTHVGGFIGGNLGTINRSYSLGSVTGVSGTNIGGFVGINQAGSINDSYSMGPVNGGAISNVAGFAALNQASLNRVYSIGYVNGVNGSVGGLVGSNAGTVTNSFWNTETAGQASSGAGVGKTTAQMMQQATYTGWTFPTTWNIINNQSYPYLSVFYPSTPRAISGTSAASANTIMNFVSTNSVGAPITDTAYTGANGSYYFLEGTNVIPSIFSVNHSVNDGTLFFIYASGATKLNLIAKAPVNTGSLNNLNLTVPNTLLIGGATAISNTDIGTVSSGIAASNLLFSVSGSALTLGNGSNPNAILTTTPGSIYVIDGNISTTVGGTSNAVFGGTVSINTPSFTTSGSQIYNDVVTLGSDVTLTTTNSDVIFNSLASINSTGIGRNLTINAGAGAITLAMIGNQLSLGALTLNSTGITTLNNTVNAASLTTNALGSTTIGASSITTSGNQIYNDAVTLVASSILTGSAITLNDTLSGGFNLSLTSPTININGGSVNTGAANQSYTGTLNFGANTTFTGNLITLNGGFNTNVDLIFSSSSTTLNGASYASNAGTQNYTGQVILGSNVIISGSTLTFGSNISGNHNLTVSAPTINFNGSSINTSGSNQSYTGTLNFAGNTSFIGNSLTFNTSMNVNVDLTFAGNNIFLNGGSYNTNINNQTYTGPITLGANTIINGATLTLNGASGNFNFDVTGNSIILNGGTYNTNAGTQSYSGPIILGGNTDFIGSTITINNTIGGNFNLSMMGNNFLINGNAINTVSGTQTYNGLLILGTNTTLTGSTLSINSGVSGGGNILNLIGSDMTVSGALDLSFLSVTGNDVNNSLTLNNGYNQNYLLTGTSLGTMTIGSIAGSFNNLQNIHAGTGNNQLTGPNVTTTWNLTGLNSGNVAGSLAYTQIQNLIGGSHPNTFYVTSPSARITGSLNGGSLANINTLDFNNGFNNTVNVHLLGSIFQGSVEGVFPWYTNINRLVGNNDTINTIYLPAGKSIRANVVLTGIRSGYIGDPLYFVNFDFPILEAPIVSPIIEHLPIFTTTPSSHISSVDINIDQILQAYQNYLHGIQINPFCTPSM